MLWQEEEKTEARWENQIPGFKSSLRSGYPHVSLFKSSNYGGRIHQAKQFSSQVGILESSCLTVRCQGDDLKFREEPWSVPGMLSSAEAWPASCQQVALESPTNLISHLLPGQVPAAVDIVAHPPGEAEAHKPPRTSDPGLCPASGGQHCEVDIRIHEQNPGRFLLPQPAEPLHLPWDYKYVPGDWSPRS